jgi:ParB family chromosome partitioning protein
VNERKRGLGRGLGALIPTAPVKGEPPAGPSAPSPVDLLIPNRAAGDADRADERSASDGAATDGTAAEPAEAAPGATAGASTEAGAYFAELPLDAITPNPRQPRQVFDQDAMAELVHSVREVGLLQPVVVRPLGEDRYELIMGERRWRAAREAGLPAIPAIVRATGDDVMLRDALLENLHRSQLNPLEEAAAYDQMLQDFGCTHDELASRIGRSRPQISNTLRLLKLPPVVQRRVAAGVLSAGHARALLGLAEAAAQERLAQRIVAEGLSVRTVEEIVSVGDGGPAPRRSAARRPVAPKLETLAARLSDRFETRVKVDLGRSKGRIVVEFGSIDDLERIVGLMAPGGADADSGADAGNDAGNDAG